MCLAFRLLLLKALAKQILLFDKVTLICPLGNLYLDNLCCVEMKDL